MNNKNKKKSMSGNGKVKKDNKSSKSDSKEKILTNKNIRDKTNNNKIQKKPNQNIEKKEDNIKEIKEKTSQNQYLGINENDEKHLEYNNLAISDNRNYDKKTKKTANNIDATTKNQFKIGDFVVYPSHGIGKIIAINTIQISNQDKQFYSLNFEKEKLIINIPVDSYQNSGLRQLTSKSQIDEVLIILRSGVKKLKGMWSRRAQEYEAKINSGNIMQLAEVIRDLTRDIDDNERSYSERVIYETAIYRLATEYGCIFKIDYEDAKNKIIAIARDKIENEYKENRKNNEFDDFDFDEFERKNNKKLENVDNEDIGEDEIDDEFEDDEFEDDEFEDDEDSKDYNDDSDEDEDFNDEDDEV